MKLNVQKLLLTTAIGVGLLVVFMIADNHNVKADDSVLFKYNGKNYTSSDLSPAAKQQLYEAQKTQHEHIAAIIDGEILKEHFKSLAKKKGVTVSQIEEETLKVEVSEAKLQSWYEQNKARLGGRELSSIKNDVLQYLTRLEQNNARLALVSKIKTSGKFELISKAPVRPSVEINAKGFPSKGNEKASIKIVEFADYLCPHCKMASKNLKKVIEKNKDKVHFVYMDFPLRDSSKSIAVGAACAHEQGKFWDFHYLAFEKQSELSSDSSTKLAEELKLNLDAFKACLSSEKSVSRVQLAKAEGERIGVNGTPAIFINGLKFNGYSEEQLDAEIARLSK